MSVAATWRTSTHMGRLLPLVLVILSVAAPARGQAGVPPDADRLMARGIELHQAGDILGAIDAYKAVLAMAPARADALSNLGAAYVRLGQYDDAIKQYEAALQSDALEQRRPPESRARLLQVGAPERRHPAVEAGRLLRP